MADNWLENKQAALAGGKTIVRKVNPSLETLLHKIASQPSPLPEAQEGALNRVMGAQLEAICRAARILNPQIELSYAEGARAIITVSAAEPPSLERTMLCMQLKAAEMGLSAEVDGNRLYIQK